jgi:hypothetical protein
VFNAAISAGEMGSDWRRELSILGDMLALKINAAISACELGSEWRVELLILGDMLALKINRCDLIYGSDQSLRVTMVFGMGLS